MRKILIDSHVLLWWLHDSRILSDEHKKMIDDTRNSIVLSIASLFELYLKSRRGKLVLNETLERDLAENDIQILQISFPHLTTFSSLVYHHKDPFDRMIIAQAISENIPLISYDSIFEKYDVEIL